MPPSRLLCDANIADAFPPCGVTGLVSYAPGPGLSAPFSKDDRFDEDPKKPAPTEDDLLKVLVCKLLCEYGLYAPGSPPSLGFRSPERWVLERNADDGRA
eukprot:scaffold48070_cov34-Tisochrysis_lutea.AAC.2